jgi:hypothetical protein
MKPSFLALLSFRALPSFRASARNLQLFLTLLLLGAQVARAQGGVQLQGIVDGEFWSTDTTSILLRRNAGSPQGVGRLTLWGAVEPLRAVDVYGMVEMEGATDTMSERYAGLEQLGVRITPSSHFVFDAGKFPHLVGAFTSRRFSNRNPLIGTPDIYPDEYPRGVKIGGVFRWFDYRAGLVDLPVVHAPEYTPDPTRRWRPAIGAGFSPYIGTRVGVAYTQGTYLNKNLPAASMPNAWDRYRQRVLATELTASVGYFELNAELTRPSYDAPTASKPVEGLGYYAEGKYTFTPRLFIATRLERNDYPFIQYFPFNGGFWVATRTDFHDQEYGIGYRVTANTMLKASYRHDTWHVNDSNRSAIGPGGRAIAVQLSQSFDVIDWIDRVRNGAP